MINPFIIYANTFEGRSYSDVEKAIENNTPCCSSFTIDCSTLKNFTVKELSEDNKYPGVVVLVPSNSPLINYNK